MTKGPHRCSQGCREPHDRAFCSECFESRHCGKGKSERMLKCEYCGVQTLHVVSGEQSANDAPLDIFTMLHLQPIFCLELGTPVVAEALGLIFIDVADDLAQVADRALIHAVDRATR